MVRSGLSARAKGCSPDRPSYNESYSHNAVVETVGLPFNPGGDWAETGSLCVVLGWTHIARLRDIVRLCAPRSSCALLILSILGKKIREIACAPVTNLFRL